MDLELDILVMNEKPFFGFENLLVGILSHYKWLFVFKKLFLLIFNPFFPTPFSCLGKGLHNQKWKDLRSSLSPVGGYWSESTINAGDVQKWSNFLD